MKNLIFMMLLALFSYVSYANDYCKVDFLTDIEKQTVFDVGDKSDLLVFNFEPLTGKNSTFKPTMYLKVKKQDYKKISLRHSLLANLTLKNEIKHSRLIDYLSLFRCN